MDEIYLLIMPYEGPHLKTPERYMGKKQNGEVSAVYIGLDGRSYRTGEALAEAKELCEINKRPTQSVTSPDGTIEIVPVPLNRMKNTGKLEEAAKNASKVIRSTLEELF